ncbi:MAG: F0F1 ATP synthase subunit B [Elusimicrobiota bacterium]
MDKLLTPDSGLVIWTIVTFLTLVFILRRFAWGPLLAVIEEREGRIRADREAAQSARQAAEKMRAEVEARLEGLSAAGKQMLDKARAQAETLGARLKDVAEEEARAIKSRAGAELAAEKDRLVAELRKEVASLSILAAEKLLRRSVDESVQKSVLDSFFHDLEKQEAVGRN